MPEPTVDRDPVEFLAAEFVDRLRQGERPTIEEYVAAHPDCAEQIRDLFPTIAAMENLKLDKEVASGGRASLGPTKIERLGDLRIIREIGRGGMGIVYEAEQESLGRRVAVKVLPKQSLLDDKHLRRFRREAKTAAKLHHTNIVPILGVGEQDGFHYYVMQIIRGAGLDEIIPQLNDLTNASSIEVVSSGRKRRPANVSSVARALVNGELRSLARSVDSWGSGNDLLSAATSGTDSNRNAITTVLQSEGDSIAVDESFEIDSDDKISDGADQDSDATLRPTTRFGTAYWQSVARIGVQVANALNYAHRQGTLHRDIKPANLLIDEGGTVWVADFGLAKAIEQDNISRSGDIVGTLRYMAPEQFQGNADARSDIYSLGLTLYELLTLTPAFDETQRKRSFIHDSGPLEPARHRRSTPSIPRDLETIVLKAIASEPDRRYQTSAELSEDLQRFLEDRPILARRASMGERLRRWARRNPAVASLSGLAVSLLLLVAVVSTAAYFQTKQEKERAETAQSNERQQRVKAEATSQLAWDALDKIFERLAPHRYVSPEDFVVDTEEAADFEIETKPVLSDESAALLDEMLVFYLKLADQGDDSAEFRQRIALANRRVGDIRQRLGQYEQAEQAYRQAIGVYGQLDNETKSNPKQAASLASIYNELGEVLRRTHRHDDARTAFDDARAILEPVASRDSPPEVRYELARSIYLTVRRSDFRSNGGPFGSSGGGRGGNRGGSRSGSPPERRDGPAPEERGGPPSEGSRDGGRRGGGPNRDAEKIEQAVALLEELTLEHEVPDYKHLLALCYAERHRYFLFFRRDHAEQSLSQAVNFLETLVDKYPQNPDYRLTLSKVYMASCTTVLFSRGGDLPDEELAQVQDRATNALSLLNELHHDHPRVPEYIMSKVSVHKVLSMVFERVGRFDDSDLQMQEAIQLDESLEEIAGTHRLGAMPARLAYAKMLLDRSNRANDTDDEAKRAWLLQSREQLEQVIRKIKPLADADPERRRFLGFPFGMLVAVNKELHDQEAAEEAMENMKQYLPKEYWDRAQSRGSGKSPLGGRNRGNGTRRPKPENSEAAPTTS